MSRKKGLYIQLFSIHGLVRGKNVEMGRDADTGGQITYVLELAKTLGKMEEVRKVDIFTRLIRDKTVSSDYSEPIEFMGEDARIVRIPCGGGKYIRKELLWPHLAEFVDKTLKFIKSENDIPDIVHGHYPDAGYVAMELATLWGVPFVYTGHSQGRVKKLDLQERGFSQEEMNRRFRIDHRIAVEEEIITRADLIIASTKHEVKNQYGHYTVSSGGRFCVIPPGIDLDRFYPFYKELEEDSAHAERARQARFFMQKELDRFLVNHERPLILALSRPDRRKNIQGLVTAYGLDKELQAIANLAIFAGIRKDITTMNDVEKEVLTDLLLLMDKYDLYGKLAIPKRHDAEYEIPELYRLVARSGGVFINPAFNENFGLTLIEAAASGLPGVATNDGGPQDIVENCKNAILIDPTDHKQISEALRTILVEEEKWRKFSENGIVGVRKHYSWEAHCKKYLKEINKFTPKQAPRIPEVSTSDAIGKRLAKIKRLFITDIDDTLIGDDEAVAQLIEHLDKNKDKVSFGVATGRHLSSACEALKENNIPDPDIVITSVGTEIYYGPDLLPDKSWHTHISAKWNRKKIKEVLDSLPFLSPQEDWAQRDFKLSYYLENTDDRLAKVHKVLTEHRLRYNLIYSRNMFLDVLPYRASKGKAIRYLSYKWNVPLSRILVAGDSDNDEDMLRGDMLGVIVGNHDPEMEKLRGLKHVYFSEKNYAAGILDGFAHYNFLNSRA